MRDFIDGNEAIVRAAIDAGCNFFAGYPITPATSILLHMTRELPKIGGIAVQGEDEIASFGFCIGAALTGKRVMTATSGPGISLYSENISAAIMIEIPLVIVDVQRMGPATGAPTLGSYGDVQFVRWCNSGGFPIIALAPTNVSDCYNLTLKAFDLSERFRTPVFILTDKETSLTKSTIDLQSLDKSPVRTRELTPDDLEYIPSNYISPSEVQPMSHYGEPRIVRYTASSHTEEGNITKDPESIRAHNVHLAAKINDHIDEITSIEFNHQPGAETLIISYGITAQAVEEAVSLSRKRGIRISHLIIYSLWPVPEEKILVALDGIDRIIIPELNLGLYKREIERLTKDNQKIISMKRLDGRLFSPTEIADSIQLS